MNKLQIFLLVIIIIGLGLIFTQKLWVPSLVDYINSSTGTAETPQVPGGIEENIETGSTLPTPPNPIVAENPEGEADPSRMTLGMNTWKWIQTQYSDDKLLTPKTPGQFTLSFRNDGTFSATTDCNGVGGKYQVTGNQITFSEMVSTLMYCEGSQEADFNKMLGQVQSFFFTSKGELVFDLKFDSGSSIFR